MDILNHISLWISLIGIAILTWGVILTTFDFLRLEFLTIANKLIQSPLSNCTELRRKLASFILLGLEFMIAGDIIHTVLEPDRQSLIVLGSIVAIRTVISYFLNKELKSDI